MVLFEGSSLLIVTSLAALSTVHTLLPSQKISWPVTLIRYLVPFINTVPVLFAKSLLLLFSIFKLNLD